MSTTETIAGDELAEALDGFWLHVACEGRRVHGQVADPGEVASVLLATLGRIAAERSPDEDGPVPGEGSDGADEERAEPHMALLDAAWGVIANAGWDDCAKTAGWQEAAVRWRAHDARGHDWTLRGPWGDHRSAPSGTPTPTMRTGPTMTTPDPQPGTTAVPGQLVMPQDEFEAVRKVAQRLGMLPPSPALPEPDTAAMSAVEGDWRERAEAAEGKLAAIADHIEARARDFNASMPFSVHPKAIKVLGGDILAIIGTEEEVSGDDQSFMDPAL